MFVYSVFAHFTDVFQLHNLCTLADYWRHALHKGKLRRDRKLRDTQTFSCSLVIVAFEEQYRFPPLRAGTYPKTTVQRSAQEPLERGGG